MTKMLLTTQNTVTKAGRFVSKGQPVSADEVDYDAETSTNLIEAPASLQGTQPIVEISAIAPTGPNPTNPQQIAPDVVQTGVGYEQAGVRLVGDVTKPETQRITIVGIDSEKAQNAQADVNEALEKGAEKAAQIEADRLEEVRENEANALDHDGDGRKGGMRKKG